MGPHEPEDDGQSALPCIVLITHGFWGGQAPGCVEKKNKPKPTGQCVSKRGGSDQTKSENRNKQSFGVFPCTKPHRTTGRTSETGHPHWKRGPTRTDPRVRFEIGQLFGNSLEGTQGGCHRGILGQPTLPEGGEPRDQGSTRHMQGLSHDTQCRVSDLRLGVGDFCADQTPMEVGTKQAQQGLGDLTDEPHDGLCNARCCAEALCFTCRMVRACHSGDGTWLFDVTSEGRKGKATDDQITSNVRSASNPSSITPGGLGREPFPGDTKNE